MRRYLCIHGHFYQPPRENPWLEAIERQPSAHPFHDWNQRVSAECYRPNTAARRQDAKGCIVDITSNYASISFDIGPTLHSWLAAEQPAVATALRQADQKSQAACGGHGAAMAQGYHHLILPLANARDRATQVAWGAADFAFRYGRPAEGMWLPETAVNTATLEALAAAGMRFTVLAAHQAARVRRRGGGAWKELGEERIDTGQAYRVRLPSGRSLALFFYDGELAHEVAFDGLLRDGEELARRLLSRFDPGRDGVRLVHFATDGETYGHHHRFGEMALASALHALGRDPSVRITNYGQFLQLHPAEDEVAIREDTSWSCAHGVERWRGDCGCNSGGHPQWRQNWRKPLRAALDGLRDRLALAYEAAAGRLFRDPWAARDAYIAVLLDRSPETLRAFLGIQAGRELAAEDAVRGLELLELQRHLMLMYTSCGWFFDEVSGLETVQVLRYAARAIELADRTLDEDCEKEFLGALAAAPSNVPEYRDGRGVYEALVRPAVVTPAAMAAQLAAMRLAKAKENDFRSPGYAVEWLASETSPAGLRGRVRVTEAATGRAQTMECGAARGEGTAITGWAGKQRLRFEDMRVDAQADITAALLAPVVRRIEAADMELWTQFGTLLEDVEAGGGNLSPRLRTVAEQALRAQLQVELARDAPAEAIETVLRRVAEMKIALVGEALDPALEPAWTAALTRAGEACLASPRDAGLRQQWTRLVELARRWNGPLDLWQPQNLLFQYLKTGGVERFDPVMVELSRLLGMCHENE